MNVLLIVAPFYYPHSEALRTELLGVLYLAANLRSHGHNVTVLDPTIERPIRIGNSYYYGMNSESLKDEIMQLRPDFVGISCHYSYSRKEAYTIAETVKEINPKIVTALGGLFATLHNERILQECSFLDYVFLGESEQSLLELLSGLESAGQLALERIDGLVYRKDKAVLNNGKNNFIEDLDSLPYPARDIVDIKLYMNSKTILYGLGARPALSLLTSRSCPYNCSFCNMWLVHGSRWRPRSPENVIGEIDEIVNKYNAEHVFIMDDNFTFDIERAKEICSLIIQKGYKFRWNTPNGISVKKLDRELIRLMKKSGCVNVCIGIESGSQYLRNEAMNKNVSDEDIVKAVELFHAEKIPVGGFLLLGMPGEDDARFKETVKLVNHLKLSFIAVNFVIPFPGSKLYSNLVNEGIIPEGYAPAYDNFKLPAFTTRDFSINELLARRNKLLSTFYLTHIPGILNEFFTGRLNWISRDMTKRLFAEKLPKVFN